jgi:hypothetical protein
MPRLLAYHIILVISGLEKRLADGKDAVLIAEKGRDADIMVYFILYYTNKIIKCVHQKHQNAITLYPKP